MLAIVCPFPPWHTGGVESLVNKSALYLRNQHNMDIEIFCTSPTGKIENKKWNDIPVSVFKGYTKSVYFYSPQLQKALKKSNFDMIHAHSLNSFMPLASARAKKNRPMILNPHYHPTGSKPHYKLLKKMYDPLIKKQIFDNVDVIICVSEYEKKQLITNLNISNKKTYVIPNGIDLNEIKTAKKFEFLNKLILYVGRLEKYKNIDRVIRAIVHLPDEYVFYIFGNGTYKNNLQRLIDKLNLNDRIKIRSDLSTSGIHRWMQTADLFITLSDIEAFGITVIEALAAGTPVIVNNKTALTEFPLKFPDEVFPVNLDDISIKELAENIAAKIDITVNISLERYSWETITDEYKRVYDEINSGN